MNVWYPTLKILKWRTKDISQIKILLLGDGEGEGGRETTTDIATTRLIWPFGLFSENSSQTQHRGTVLHMKDNGHFVL